MKFEDDYNMARFLGKKSLEKSNRNKANRFKKSIEFFNRSNISIEFFHRSNFFNRSNFSIDPTFQSIENFNRFILPFNLPMIT